MLELHEPTKHILDGRLVRIDIPAQAQESAENRSYRERFHNQLGIIIGTEYGFCRIYFLLKDEPATLVNMRNIKFISSRIILEE